MLRTTLQTAKELTVVAGKSVLIAADTINTAHAWAKDNSEAYTEMTKGDLIGSNAFYQKKHVDKAETALSNLFGSEEEVTKK